MSKPGSEARTDTASRLIGAEAGAIYQAHLDPNALAAWRPPEGMSCRIDSFDPREGGRYRMSFLYDRPGDAASGKTSAGIDSFEGEFVVLVPDRRIVERVAFESDDSRFAGAMTITTSFEPRPGGTEVTIRCENVPPGISEADHQKGLASTLRNLAAFVE